MDRGDAAYAEEMGPEPAPPSDAAQQGEAAGEALAARKIIRDAELEVQTLSYDEFLPALETAIDEAGGYVQSSYTSGNGYYGSRLRSAEIVARIPAEGLDAFLAGVGGLGKRGGPAHRPARRDRELCGHRDAPGRAAHRAGVAHAHPRRCGGRSRTSSPCRAA